MDQATAYGRSRDRIVELVDEPSAGTDVPTTPGWTVKDVVAHLAGFISTYKTDPKDGFGPDWGDREVEARRNKSLQECIDEWDSLLRDPGDIFESRLGPVAVSDILAHEQDIRTALGKPGAEDDENIVPAIEMALSFVEHKLDGSQSFRVVTEDIDRQVGKGEPAATLRTSTFDLFRALHGRRTIDQVREMQWAGDPEPFLDDFFIFGPTEVTVEK